MFPIEDNTARRLTEAQAFDKAPQLAIEHTVTATGSAITDAYDITKPVTLFSTVSANTGAQLPDQYGVFFVRNGGASALTLYPHSASAKINGGSDGAGVSVAAGEIAIMFRFNALNWVGGVAVTF